MEGASLPLRTGWSTTCCSARSSDESARGWASSASAMCRRPALRGPQLTGSPARPTSALRAGSARSSDRTCAGLLRQGSAMARWPATGSELSTPLNWERRALRRTSWEAGPGAPTSSLCSSLRRLDRRFAPRAVGPRPAKHRWRRPDRPLDATLTRKWPWGHGAGRGALLGRPCPWTRGSAVSRCLASG